MGRKRPQKGGRRGAGKKSSPRDQRRSDATADRAVAGTEMSGPSRLRLTRVVREGTIWDVYVSTTAQNGAPNITCLEFESKGASGRRLRHTRPLEGALLEALHSGAPISRARLEEELDLAFRDAAAPSEPSDPADADPHNGP